ncbi:MAG: threonine synthase [Deltaproteobacteria bacterium]|nr:threonine synthase [Deltaproteobacteria bacterium]
MMLEDRPGVELLELIGRTPLLRLARLTGPGEASLYGKAEFLNPGGSIKDRICLGMLDQAAAEGRLHAGDTVVEPTTGNTGIGLALVCAVRGYRLVLVMPESTDPERRALLASLGAEVMLTPAADGMRGAIKQAEELASGGHGTFMPRQFANPMNPEIHRRSTGPEILAAMGHTPVDALVAGVGTGGTITGVGEVLKAANPRTLVIAVEPARSPVLSGGPPGAHQIQGIGPGFIPEVLNLKLLDDVIQVSDEEAHAGATRLAREEGTLAGLSSGAAVAAALRLAGKLGGGRSIVVILPDRGERYLCLWQGARPARPYPTEPLHVCEFCFGPLEVVYDYEGIRKVLNRRTIAGRAPNMWRYRELLPLAEPPTIGLDVGFTPLVRAHNLAKALGVTDLYLKNDAVSHPTLSFKDRVVAVALSKAREFGFRVVACASTGNLANSVAALAASGGMESYVFIPSDLEQGKVLGTSIFGSTVVGIHGNYDEVNRLCSEIAGKYGWAFVNINIRPYYAEGSKTFGLEIVEQLGWRLPAHIVVPMAGGSLITKVLKAFNECRTLGLIDGGRSRIHGAQATGCAPITTAVKEGKELFRPVRPNTIAKSLAIGNPADGFYATKTIRDSGGYGEDVTDEEIVDAMKLLAETEGVFTETAGGVTVGVAKKLIESGRIPRDEPIIISITGNGLKTQEVLAGRLSEPLLINARLGEFDALVASKQGFFGPDRGAKG